VILIILAYSTLGASPLGSDALRNDSSYIAGETAEDDKDYEKALQLYQDSQDRFPTEERLFEKIGACYLALERYANAIRNYERGLQKHPQSTLLQYNIAVAYRLNGQHELASENFKRLLEVEPGDDVAWFLLGGSLMALHKDAESEDAFLRASAITSDDAATWHNLGIVCERQGKTNDAQLHFARAIRLDPKNKDNWTRFRSLMASNGPQAPYVNAWLEAPESHDLDAYRKRAEKKAQDVAQDLFPQLRDATDSMWDAIRKASVVIKSNNPNLAASPSIVIFCAIVAAERLGIVPHFPGIMDSGNGELSVYNGTGSDALIKIVSLSADRLWKREKAAKGSTISFTEVPDGHYLVYFALAEVIDETTGKLSKDAHASRFEKSVAFTTGSKLEGNVIRTTTTRYSMTLHPVIGGNAKTKDVSLAEFEKY
jgi:tetratricopeptide (TPR) repeat protein